MPYSAYVFIEVIPSLTEAVFDSLRTIEHADVHQVMGPYDIVVTLRGNARTDIAEVVRDHIRPLEGVIRTVTCPWVT